MLLFLIFQSFFVVEKSRSAKFYVQSVPTFAISSLPSFFFASILGTKLSVGKLELSSWTIEKTFTYVWII